MRKSEIGFIICWLLCALLLFCSCSTTKQTAKETVRVQRDTIYMKTLQKDSIYFRDSVWTYVKGDTVLSKEFHTKYINSLLHDTIYLHKTDTVSTDVQTVVTKDKSWWEKIKEYIGGLILIAVIGLLIVALIEKKTSK